MSLTKTLQTLAAVTALVNLAKEAQKDTRITAQEWGVIMTNGVLPLLELHGVIITAPKADGVNVDVFRDRVASAISLLQFLDEQ
ncbi:MAG: hypothetical protein ONB55_22520 [candidate division KSB1 bacterium]|nr:hypothetical protein [candidate division KSB1 bacterium]